MMRLLAKTGELKLEDWLKVFAAITAACAFGAGLWQYSSNHQNEYRKAIWKEQYALYDEVCGHASALAVAKDLAEKEEDRVAYWKLYWGRLSILEHPEVKQAMMKYGGQLRSVEAGRATPASLQPLSYQLARECRESLRKTWNPVELGDIDDSK